MPPARNDDSLRKLQGELETFLNSLGHPVVVEDEIEQFDLTAARWKLSIEFGKLIFEAWNDARSIARRIEEIAYRDRGRIGVFARQPGGRESGRLEFRDLERPDLFPQAARAENRARGRKEFLAMLGREFSGWRLERVSNRSDREHSFSTWYTRGLARQGRSGWAFLLLAEGEAFAASDGVLAHALIWLDWLRARSDRDPVSGLKLFLPRGAVALTAHRAACLNARALQLEIFEWKTGDARPRPIELKDFGNVETRLAPRRQGEALAERHRETLRQLLGDPFDRVDIAPDPSASYLSLRVKGLEIARLEGQLAPRIFFGLEGNCQRLNDANSSEFRGFLNSVLEFRDAHGKDPAHEFYRLQSERWLESLILRDITRIDPELSPECVYPQVPAFSGTDRGIIDVLAVTRAGRLSVIELKLQEEINLPMQGLDYWLRVKWLAERKQFQERGYFPGVELSDAPPVLQLVCPAFRFHSTTGSVVRAFHPAIEVVQVGLNEQWREGVRVLFRRKPGAAP